MTFNLQRTRQCRVCYVVSFFHPFASGAERQALVQGAELVKRGHTVHVVTRAVPGYPIDDEEYQGIFIHRWIKTATRGPLFGLSFVAGVIARAQAAPLRDRLDPHPPGAVGGRGDRAGASSPVRQADPGSTGQRRLLRRGGRAGPDERRPALAPGDPGQHRLRGDLGGDRARVARARCRGRADHAHGQRRRRRDVPPRRQLGRSRIAPPPARDLHGPPSSAEKLAALARGLDRSRPPQPRQLDLGRARQRSPAAHRAGGHVGDLRPRSVCRRGRQSGRLLAGRRHFCLAQRRGGDE